MKINELNDFRKKELKDLLKALEDKKKKLVMTRIEIKASREKNLKLGKILSDEIAKILTLIREREILDKDKVKKVDKSKDK